MKCPRCGENHSWLFSLKYWVPEVRGYKCKKCKGLFYAWNDRTAIIALGLLAFSVVIVIGILNYFKILYSWIWFSAYTTVTCVGLAFFNIKHTVITVNKSEQQIENETFWGILPATHQGKWRIPPIILILLGYSVFMGVGSMSWVNGYLDVIGPWSKYMFVGSDVFFVMVAFFIIADILFIKGDFKFTKSFAILLFIFHIVDFILIPLDFGQMVELRKIFISKLAMCWIIIFNVGIPLIWLKVLHFSGFKKLFSETFGLIVRDFRKV